MKSWRISWRNLMRKKWRTILTLIAVIIGVASTVAAISTVQTTQSTIADYTKKMYGNVDYYILSQKGLFDENLLSKVKEVDGVSDVIGVSEERMDLHNLTGGNVESAGRVKIEAVTDAQSEILQLDVDQGSLTEDGLIIDKQTSSIWNVNVGEEVVFQKEGQLHHVEISAIVENSPMMINPSSWSQATGKAWQVIMPLHVYQKSMGEEGQLQQIKVRGDEGVNENVVRNNLNKALKENDAIFIQPAVADENQVATGFDELYSSLYMIGGLSLLISVFILYNTLHISIVERRSEFAIMKAVGYTPGQVRGRILQEVSILSLVGTLIGIAAGIGLSFGLVELMFSVFQDNLTYDIQLTQAIVIGFVAGIIVPLIAVSFPVYTASQIHVSSIFREELVEKSAKLFSLRYIIGVILLVSGVLINHLFAFLPLVLGLALLFPLLFKMVAWVFYPVNKLLFGREGKLAFRNMKRHNNRTAMTTAILTFGIILLVYMSSLSIGVKESMANLTSQTLGGDIWISLDEGISAPEAKELQKVSGVNELATFRSDSLIWQLGDEKRLLPINSVTRENIKSFPLFTTDQPVKLEKPNTIVLGSAAFDVWGGNIGGKLEFDTKDGPQKMEVVGVVDTMRQGGYIAFTNEQNFAEIVGSSKPNQVLLLTDHGKTEEIKQAILNNDDLTVNTVLTLPEEIAASEQQMEEIFFMLNALVVLGVMVAGIGILNTLLMNMLERIREIGTMRALGFTRGQLRKMMMSEAFFIGAIAAFIGVILGILLIFITTLQEIDILSSVPFVVSWVGILGGIIFSIVVSMIACLIPSNKATKIPVSNALKHE